VAELFEIPLREDGTLHEIHGRVAAQGEFREDSQSGAAPLCLSGRLADFRGVLLEVSRHRIDLGQRDFHILRIGYEPQGRDAILGKMVSKRWLRKG